MHTLFVDNAVYPNLLREIYDSPERLFCEGSLDCFEQPCLAIVGTRRCTPYGEQQAFRFGQALAQAGVCVVSGLAYGVDASAHRGALEGGGKTIAVVAQSLKELRPVRNRGLAREIVKKGGLVLTEKLLGEPCYKSDYLVRNRLISGLSGAVLVVEAALRSGALNTANHALEQNRDVYALPGRLTDPQSAGTNELLRRGAKIVLRPEDLLADLGLAGVESQVKVSEFEQRILDTLKEPMGVGLLCEAFKKELPELYRGLMSLERKGLVRQSQDRRYSALNSVTR